MDVRGVHRLPTADLLGLPTVARRARETVTVTRHDPGGPEIDLVTHDAGKFCGLLAKPNGYVLEQLLSPLVVHTGPAHGELRAVAGRLVTAGHARHYLGFAASQRKLLAKHDPPRVKPLLYLYRVLLTGRHLMETGTVEANLPRLLEEHPTPGVADLIARKRAGEEKGTLPAADLPAHLAACDRLEGELTAARDRSPLPAEVPASALAALDDWLVRLRTA